MGAFIVKRVLATIPVMGVVAVMVFLLLHLSPGDPAAIIAGDFARPADVERIRERLGLDQPIYIQFLTWVGNLLQGDFGISIFSNRPVTALVAQRLEPTVSLAAATILVAIVIAVPMGVIAAWKTNTWVDRTVMVFAVLGFSVPVFVVGYALIYVVSLRLDLLPVQGYVSFREGLWPFISHLILPSFTLGIAYIALIARITRASVLEVLTEDYIRTAHAKGLPERRVLVRHALRNAAVPIVTVIGIGVALLIGGVVVTETVYNIPGLGRLVVDAILKRDYPIIQALIIMFSGVYVLINLVIDMLYTALDPRIRY
jgi:peptide/nickel transport system permease protein